MPKGGARVRSGPPKDPNALRRSRDAGEWITLPAEGRAGDPPEWPLTVENPHIDADKRRVWDAMREREVELWFQLWGRPQAAAWEAFGLDFEVAIFVRKLVEAEQPESPVSLGTLIRQSMDSLGLTVPGMARNKWCISGDDMAQYRQGMNDPAEVPDDDGEDPPELGSLLKVV